MNKIIIITLLITISFAHKGKGKMFEFINNSNLSENDKQSVVEKMKTIWHNEELDKSQKKEQV